jgi:hypothetical protein
MGRIPLLLLDGLGKLYLKTAPLCGLAPFVDDQ